MATNLTFAAYRLEVTRKAAETVAGFVRGPSGKFRPRHVGQARFGGEPLPFPGYTALTKPYPLEQTIRALLEPWQYALADRSTAFVAVPPETFHMTVADLVAGPAYLELRRQGWNTALHQRVQSILAAHRLERPLHGTMRGVGAFPTSVIALVDFETPTAYRELERLREVMYADVQLARLSVGRGASFIGHVTLGDVESDTPSNLDEALEEIRRTLAPARFAIDDVGLFIFSDLSHYREEAEQRVGAGGAGARGMAPRLNGWA